jgi:hypothetical protein
VRSFFDQAPHDTAHIASMRLLDIAANPNNAELQLKFNVGTCLDQETHCALKGFGQSFSRCVGMLDELCCVNATLKRDVTEP